MGSNKKHMSPSILLVVNENDKEIEIADNFRLVFFILALRFCFLLVEKAP